MRFLILGDLHGQLPKFQVKGFDAIIAAGDFCSDAHRPAMFQAVKHNMINPQDKVSWYDLIGKREAKRLVDQSVKDGRKVLEKLNAVGVPVYVVPGNNDWTANKKSSWTYERNDFYTKNLKGLKNIIDVYHKRLDIGEFELIGHGISSGPEYPQYKEDKQQHTKTELMKMRRSYERLEKKVGKLFVNAKKPVIFLSHNVPFNTEIDQIKNAASPRNGWHYGSVLARDMVKKYQPLVCTGGHMHEHFKAIKLRKTTCINAGYGANCNVLLEIVNGKIERLEFYGRAQQY